MIFKYFFTPVSENLTEYIIESKEITSSSEDNVSLNSGMFIDLLFSFFTMSTSGLVSPDIFSDLRVVDAVSPGIPFGKRFSIMGSTGVSSKSDSKNSNS